MSALFKDHITKSRYEDQINDLLRALRDGDDAMKQLLLKTAEPKLYVERGKYYLGKHAKNKCSGVTGGGHEEDQLCKCLYFYNREGGRRDLTKCRDCVSPKRYTLVGPYQIMDYQVPAYYDVPGVGKIDLVLTDGKTPPYATEVKPPKGNSETLLRMVAEVLTYTLGTPKTEYQRAIAFFENTPQDEEYKTISSLLRNLLDEAEITVFRFEKQEGNTYEICKL